jgi:ABC-type lipoprotein export system ATPase subunit
MSEPLLTLQNVYKYYTGNQSVVMGLNHIDLTFHRGEFVAVTGESGSGKSTLAQVICGVLPYESGEMLLFGKPTSHYDSADWERYRREKISYISQNYGILAGSTVLTNVTAALRIAGVPQQEAEQRAEQLLKLVELWDLKNRRAAKLSSGQKQRLSIARALAKPAPILVADEPTGNLDPENSAKVIELLAQAAKERLVILITHDFQEAKAYATRRIQLQDGQVTADAALQPAKECPEQPQSAGKPGKLRFFTAKLQMAGRLVWSSLVLLFFTLTAFGVFAFLGTLIVNLDDTPTRIYDASAFVNGTKTRIVVQRSDLGPLTEADWNKILGAPHAVALERSGYVADLQYAWQQGVDYEVNYRVEQRGDDDHRYSVVKTTIVPLADKMAFLQTLPMLAGERSLLTAGRMPENMSEVVMAGSEADVGKTLSVYVQDKKNWALDAYLKLDVTVVGVTDYGTGLYFHEDLGATITGFMMGGGWSGGAYLYLPVYGESIGMDVDIFRELNGTNLTWPEELTETYTDENGEEFIRCFLPGAGYCAISQQLYEKCLRYYFPGEILLKFPGRQEGETLAENVVGYHDSTFIGAVQLLPEDFAQVLHRENANQVSLTIADYAYTEEVLEQLQGMGYIALSPFRQGSTEKDPALAAERMQTLLICLGALVGAIVLQILVLKELFGVQLDSYKLLADMGLSCADAKASVLWQVMLFALCGEALGFGIIQLCAGLGVERIVMMLRYLPPANWLILLGVHLIICLVAGLITVRTVAKRVYPQTAQAADLNMGKEADA